MGTAVADPWPARRRPGVGPDVAGQQYGAARWFRPETYISEGCICLVHHFRTIANSAVLGTGAELAVQIIGQVPNPLW